MLTPSVCASFSDCLRQHTSVYINMYMPTHARDINIYSIESLFFLTVIKHNTVAVYNTQFCHLLTCNTVHDYYLKGSWGTFTHTALIVIKYIYIIHKMQPKRNSNSWLQFVIISNNFLACLNSVIIQTMWWLQSWIWLDHSCCQYILYNIT